MMDIQYNFCLSEKARGILYRFKNNLKKNNLDFRGAVCKVFEFEKGKFNRKQFHLLIRQYDNNLVMEDIDELFQGLDDNKNQVVFFEAIFQALNNITEDDNPSQALNRKSMIRFRENKDSNQKQSLQTLIEFKDRLLQSEDYLEVICLFVTQKDGFLTKQNVIEILKNFQFSNEKKQRIFIEQVFKDKNKIQIKSFLQKLGLDNLGTRVNLQQKSPEKKDKKIQQDQKSEYIKLQQIQKQKKSKIKQPRMQQPEPEIPSIMASYRNSLADNSIHYSIESIPPILQQYFNYGSQLQQPFASFAQQHLEKGLTFIDDENPTYAKAAGFVHLCEVNPGYQLFEVAKSILHRDRNRKGLSAMLEPKDIIQGGFGDCYFLSAVAAIVHDYPELVYRLFVLEKNPSHLFGVKLFIDGKWITIPLDGTFPINRYRQFCGAQPHHNQVWVMLLEKAWAKIYKSYQNIYSGYNQQGLLAISGAPSVHVSTRKQGFLRKIIAEFGKGSIITCATSKDVSQLTDQQQQKLGVFAGHAYTLLKVYQKLPYKNSTITLVKIRNPWGKKGWKGDWSFYSQTWTKQLRQKVGYEVDSQDGTFFVSLADFAVYFDYIHISKVNLAYRHSYVSNKSSRFDFYQNRFKVEQKGDYFFTLYQQNGRKYKNTAQIYEKSKSWIFLAKINKKQASGEIVDLTAIACCASYSQNNTIETTLQPGQYILISKVSWKYWNQHTYTITSYAPTKLVFSLGKIAPQPLVSKFIQSRAQQLSKHDGGKMSIYDNTNISKRYYFSHEDGIGFISLNNFDIRAFETQIRMDPCKGMVVVKPFSLPLKLFVLPYETRTVGFVVDPEGYNYNMREKYYLRNVA